MARKPLGASLREMIEWRYLSDRSATIKDLADEFGVSYQVLRNYASRHKWAEKRQEFWGQVREQTSKIIAHHLGELASYHFKLARSAIAKVRPIFEAKVEELSAADAWRIIREAVELERKSTGVDEQVKALLVDHLQILLVVLKRRLTPEQYEEIRHELVVASGASSSE